MADRRVWRSSLADERRVMRAERERMRSWGAGVGGRMGTAAPMYGDREGGKSQPLIVASSPLGEMVHVRAAPQAGFGDDGSGLIVWSDVSGDRIGFFAVPAALPTADLPYTGVSAPIDVVLGIEAADGQTIPAGTRVEVRRDGTRALPPFGDDPQWRRLSDATTFEPFGIAEMATGSELSVAVIAPEGQTVDIAGAWMTLRIPDPSAFATREPPPPEVDTGDVLWWLSHSILSLGDEAVVSEWPDSGPHGISPDIHGSPVYHQSAINGHPAVRFNGTSTRVSALNKFPPFVCNCETTKACWTVVAVIRLAAVGKAQLILGNAQAGSTEHRFGFGADNRLQVGNHSDPLTSTNPVADTGVHIVTGRAHETNGLLRFDGTTVASGPADASPIGHCGSLNVRSPQVGATGFHHSFLDGWLGDAVVIDNASLSRIEEWEGHFAAEYDL